jgi:ubiquinone/menaquinone biosynthesis C-methylase UbiE
MTRHGKRSAVLRTLSLLGGGIAIGAMVAGWWRYRRRTKVRIPSQEGLDDPDVAAGFNRIAQMPQMRLLRWYVARRAASMMPRGAAADLGCGPGLLVIDLARAAPDLHVTGVDLSEEMLSEADAQTRRADLEERTAFKKGDVARLPFPDQALDLVVSTLSLHHWRDPVAVFDEIARVLRPGGAFVVFDLRRDLAAPLWLLLWFVTRVVVPPALRRVNEPLSSRDAAYTPAEAAALVRQSRLPGWTITTGPLWLIVEGDKRVKIK